MAATALGIRNVQSTWAEKKFVELDSNGIYLLNKGMSKYLKTATSATVDPDLYDVINVDVTAGNVTMTFPADMTRYVGRTYRFFCQAQAAYNLIIACTAGQLQVAGLVPATATSIATTDNTKCSCATIFIASSTLAIATDPVNMA